MNKLIPLLLAAMPTYALDVQFNNNSAPFSGNPNHLGLNVDTGPFFKDTKDFVLIPIQYTPQKGLGFGIESQDRQETVSVTASDVQNFNLTIGEVINWEYKSTPPQKGTVTVTDVNALTVDNLLVMASDTPAGLLFKRPEPEGIPIVYVRQPRPSTPITYTGDDPLRGDIDDASNVPIVPDLGRPWYTTEADLVKQDASGNVEVIYDCTGDDDVLCIAHEPRVSPDGSKVAFAVGRSLTGEKWEIWASSGPEKTGVFQWKQHTSEVWIHEFKSGKTYSISSGHIDRGPDWYTNDILVLASDRANTYPPLSTDFDSAKPRNFYKGKAHQLYRARLKDRQLTDFRNLTPDKWFVMTPRVLSNGDICYSSYNGVSPRDFSYTPANHWDISCRDINGNNPYTELAAHGSVILKSYEYIKDWIDPNRAGEKDTTFKGIRGISELFPNYLATINYYANNAQGQNGEAWGWVTDHGKSEGMLKAKDIPAATIFSDRDIPGSGRYMPSSIISLCPWGLSQDMEPRYHKDGRAAGRCGYFNPFPNFKYGTEGRVLWTRTRGHGYSASHKGWQTYAWMGGEPPAKRQIEASFQPRILNPFDSKQSEVIACESLDYHCWDAVYAGPYVDLWGQKAPETIPLLDEPETCSITVTNAREAELWPIPGKEDYQNRIDFQGNATVTNEEYAERVTHFAIQTFRHWDELPYYEGPMVVNNMMRAAIQPDGSARIENVPCGKGWFHFGLDKDGSKIASGITPLSANGDLVCVGCHLHSTDSKQ